jgi:pimeloyl-ACP methyl ester carboxylesterase
MPDYTLIDKPELLVYVFYPRGDAGPCPTYAFDLTIPVEPDVSIHSRFYKKDDGWPWILYFHGNGEVVSDYDEIALFYFKRNLNLVVADYRGYGASTGESTFTGMAHDAPIIYHTVRAELKALGLNDRVWVMGRSLGSISALEIARRYGDDLPGIIVESGFISVVRVMRHLDVPVDDAAFRVIDDACKKMVAEITVPALVIHGEVDTIVPYDEGLDLFETLGSPKKDMLTVPAADHNTILFVGLKQYFEAITTFLAP